MNDGQNTHAKDRRGGKESLSAWIQLLAQSVVTSFPSPPSRRVGLGKYHIGWTSHVAFHRGPTGLATSSTNIWETIFFPRCPGEVRVPGKRRNCFKFNVNCPLLCGFPAPSPILFWGFEEDDYAVWLVNCNGTDPRQ